MATDLALPPEDRSTVAPPRPRRAELYPYWDDARDREASPFDLATLLRILHEWRLLILGAIALGLAGAIVTTLLTKPLYRAWVTLEVNPPTVEILDEKSREAASTPNLFDFVVTQVGLLSSRTLAERVAQDLNLASNPQFVGTEGDAATRLKIATSKVAGGLSVQAPEDGQLIRYAYVSDSPQLAADVANGIAENFISSGLQRRFEASTYARTFLQQQISRTRRDLERSERQLVQYAQQQGIINTATEGQEGSDAGSLQGASMVALNTALAEATARRVRAEGEYRQAQLAANSAEVNENTAALRQSKAALEAEYQEKRTLMKPDHPDMLSLRSRIRELDRQIATERSQVASGRTNTMLAEYRAALSAERALQSRVGQLKGSVLNLRGRSIQYNILQREVDTNRGLYDALLQRYKEIGVAGGIGTTPVSIVDRAEVPGGPYKPNLMFNLLVGLAIGLLGGIVAAIGLEILNDTVKTREDVRNKLGVACLGAIPRRRGKGSVVDDLNDPASSLSEAYSAVLAALRFSTATGAPRTLLVTSSRATEGKSSSALALAQNHARRGARVLLIDADLRRPAFKTATTKANGLTKLLTNEEPVGQHIAETQHDNLWLLPCGPIPPNPADLLSTPRIKQIIAEAAAQFDLVVVDGPPILGLADASLLASACRNAMLIIESGKTRTRAAREAIERISAAGAHIVGATLTKSAEEASHYGYRLYQYTSVADKRNQIVLIPQQAEG